MRTELYTGTNRIDEELLKEIRQYIQLKTGKTYFRSIRSTGDNLIVTCPFHKEGQERRPSCNIRVTSDERSFVGAVHCFTCGETMNIYDMLRRILGPLFDLDEIEKKFDLKSKIVQTEFIKPKKQNLFEIPAKLDDKESTLRNYRYFHPYLESRGINIDTADHYDIGYDKTHDQITFPIRDINKNCVGIGRRSIRFKKYEYPYGMIKPLYGVYELPRYINYLFIVEGPFNLWSLYQWGKNGVALLGTGTEKQYQELLKLQCNGYALCLDPDDAGRNGIHKLGTFLQNHYKKNILVLLMPEGKDVNDLTQEQFNEVPAITFNEWKKIYGKE